MKTRWELNDQVIYTLAGYFTGPAVEQMSMHLSAHSSISIYADRFLAAKQFFTVREALGIIGSLNHNQASSRIRQTVYGTDV